MVKCQKIPKTEITILASGLMGVIAEYFEDEEHMREFEEWRDRVPYSNFLFFPHAFVYVSYGKIPSA